MSKIRVVAPPWKKLPLDAYGAVERVSLDRFNALKAAGFSVELVAPWASNSAVEGISRIHRLKYHDPGEPGPLSIKAKARWLRSPSPYLYVLPYLGVVRGRHDEVVINDAFRPEPWNTYLLSKRFGSETTINVLHGEFSPLRIDWRIFRGPTKKLLYGALNKQFQRFLLKHHYRAAYFPNGITIPGDNLLVPDPDGYLVFIGRLDPSKAPHVAIEIAKRLKLRLILMGPVRDPLYFETMIKPELGSEIRYLGEVTRTILLDTLRRSRALVYAGTYGDPQPTVLLEALSYGVPILSIPPRGFSGYNDIVTDGVNGVAGKSVSEVASRVSELDRLSRRAIYTLTRAQWSWNQVIKDHYTPLFLELEKGSVPRLEEGRP